MYKNTRKHLKFWDKLSTCCCQHRFRRNWTAENISPWTLERRKRCSLPLCSCLDELARLILQTRPDYERRKRCPVWGSHTVWGTCSQGPLREYNRARARMCEWCTNYRNNKRFNQFPLVFNEKHHLGIKNCRNIFSEIVKSVLRPWDKIMCCLLHTLPAARRLFTGLFCTWT